MLPELTAPKVKVGPLTVTVIVEEVTVVAPLVPVTVTVRVPLAPVVLVIVSVLVPVPPAARVEDVGESEHVPATPADDVTAQVRATVPAKLLETRLIVSVTADPAVFKRLRDVDAGVTLKVPPLAAARYFATSSEPRPVTRS